MERDAPVLVRVRRLDSIRLDEADKTYFTDEGYLVDHPILTSTGIFEYKNPDGTTRKELRLPEEVFDKESLQSYRGKPIIVTHAAGEVDKNNVDTEGIGTILSDGYRDGDDVRAEIIIHDTDRMKASGLRELSLGYSLDLEETPGEWNGQHYDAIQRNIRVNHLALVSEARAGDTARLNLDGKDATELKGGKVMASQNNADGLTPEEIEKAIEEYKANHKPDADPTPTKPDAGTGAEGDGADGVNDIPTTDPEPDKPENAETPAGKTPSDILEEIKSHNDDASTDSEQLCSDIDALIAVAEKLLTDKAEDDNADSGNADGDEGAVSNDGCGATDNADGADDKSQSMNMDSVDEIVSKKLALCRVADKLHLDGIESMSIKEGKKAIVKKALPTMRLDGKSDAYIDAAYDMAVGEINKPKSTDYQRQQMVNPKTATKHNDGADSVPTAVSARQRMIEREGKGGNE